MKFAEFYPGQVIELGTYLLTQEEVLQFAQAYDPQWFHTDEAAAVQGPFGGLIASGWHTCALAMRLVADGVLKGSESYASPGLSYIKWPHPVRPGDVLCLRITVLEVRRSKRQPTLGIVRWRWQGFNSVALEVLDLEATSLFKLALSCF